MLTKVDKYIIDTNVPLLSSTNPKKIDPDQIQCALSCNEFIYKFLRNPNSRLVIDSDMAIFKEYNRNINALGFGPSLAKEFLIWICTQLTRSDSAVEKIKLNELDKNEYAEYPFHKGLCKFDPSDRKFIALANAHPEHPAIVEGSDCKWWGIRDAMKECGLDIIFLCEEYIQLKFEKKIGD